jgi:hypothetical protein
MNVKSRDLIFIVTVLGLCATIIFLSLMIAHSDYKETVELEKLQKKTSTELYLGEYTTSAVGAGEADKSASNSMNHQVINAEVSILVEGSVGQAIEVEKKLYSHQHRIEQAITTVIRTSTAEDIQDTDLSNIRNRLKESLNDVIDKEAIKDVILGSFRVYNMPPVLY